MFCRDSFCDNYKTYLFRMTSDAKSIDKLSRNWLMKGVGVRLVS